MEPLMELPRTQEAEIHSSLGALRDFINSTIWFDMLRELDIWYQQQVDILKEEDVLIDIYRAQGRMEVIDNLRVMPLNILEFLEAQADMEEEKMNGRSE
jgi:hypothetical protein